MVNILLILDGVPYSTVHCIVLLPFQYRMSLFPQKKLTARYQYRASISTVPVLATVEVPVLALLLDDLF